MALDPITASLNFGAALCALLATEQGQGIIADIRAANHNLAEFLGRCIDHGHKALEVPPRPVQ